MNLVKVPRAFYLRSTIKVARDILGKYLVRRIGSKNVVGRIVEVEAYLGKNDPASHSYRGRTKRNDVMFWSGGHLYVYFTYGMHFCANVVTREKGVGEAVLIRAVEPVEGVDVMAKKRGISSPHSAFHTLQLTNGPAKLCEAFGITRKHNGIDLCGDEIFIAASAGPQSAFRIRRSSRVGIRNGKEKKWRLYLNGNRWVSNSKPST